MAIGLIIIGDEIITGKRQDRHFSALIEILKKRGLHLGWVQYLSDDPKYITETLCRTFASDDIVFSCGGIGATPDDHTRKCVAEALGVSLVLHPKAKEKIYERIRDIFEQQGLSVDYQSADNLQRLKMAELPEGSQIIPNPINKIPGFSIGSHHFLPGFPEMAHPMMEWVLDTYYSARFYQFQLIEKSLIVYGGSEAKMIPLMESIESNFESVKVFSLPYIGKNGSRSHIELGVKGNDFQVNEAFELLKNEVRRMRLDYEINY